MFSGSIFHYNFEFFGDLFDFKSNSMEAKPNQAFYKLVILHLVGLF